MTKLSPDHKLLFEYLERAFKRDKLFVEDLRRLKVAIKNGACTVSDGQAAPANYRTQQTLQRAAYS